MILFPSGVLAQKAKVQPVTPPAETSSFSLGSGTPLNSSVGFEIGYRTLNGSDSRIKGGSSVFRINFPGGESSLLFFESEKQNLNFLAKGTTVPVLGQSLMETVGLAMMFTGSTRFEIGIGQAQTVFPGAAPAYASYDTVANLGFFWSYVNGKSFIDLGFLYRVLDLSNPSLGGATEPVKSLGGTLLNVGIGYLF
ncbi:MAG: hypothetical protein OEW12_00460 [Deltaproteobacteria bacterium]|nr:hypothetical protein [Deltaproteobacteria bacterium]